MVKKYKYKTFVLYSDYATLEAKLIEYDLNMVTIEDILSDGVNGDVLKRLQMFIAKIKKGGL